MSVYDWPTARFKGETSRAALWGNWTRFITLILARNEAPIVSETKTILEEIHAPF